MWTPAPWRAEWAIPPRRADQAQPWHSSSDLRSRLNDDVTHRDRLKTRDEGWWIVERGEDAAAEEETVGDGATIRAPQPAALRNDGRGLVICPELVGRRR